MIVGADDANDTAIIGKASRLYGAFGLRRVYYSASSPTFITLEDESGVINLVVCQI